MSRPSPEDEVQRLLNELGDRLAVGESLTIAPATLQLDEDEQLRGKDYGAVYASTTSDSESTLAGLRTRAVVFTIDLLAEYDDDAGYLADLFGDIVRADTGDSTYPGKRARLLAAPTTGRSEPLGVYTRSVSLEVTT